MNPALDSMKAASMSSTWNTAMVTPIHTTNATRWLSMRAAESTRWRRRRSPPSLAASTPHDEAQDETAETSDDEGADDQRGDPEGRRHGRHGPSMDRPAALLRSRDEAHGRMRSLPSSTMDQQQADEYLERIGASRDTPLAELQALHLEHVPFENLDIHLGVPITLDRDALFHKVVRRRRGGFCYELNGLFA